MINNNNVQDSPPGMKSYLPGTVNEFLTIKNRIEEIFSLWGYKPIMTPLLEYYDSLLVGMGSSTKKEFYKLIDYDGNILALRPEMTAPIARTVAGRIDEFELPARLSYYAPVYRYDSPQMGKNREIQQMGIELIGDHELADAEVLIVAIEAIKSTGLTNFKIDLGHTDYINGLVREFNFSPRQEELFHGYLIKKDFVGLKEFISNLQLQEKEAVNELLRLRGGKEVLDRAESLTGKRSSLAAIRTLREIYNYLANYGVAEYINFDLGLLRGFDYYSGVVFEAFTDRLGYTICGGGRYDNLLAQYGENMFSAVGFALGLERLRLSLQKEGVEIPADGPDCMMIYTGETAELALKLANRLHSRQIKVLLKEKKKLTEKFIEKQQNQNIKRLISLLKYQQGKVEIIKPRTGETYSINLDAGWEDKLWTHL